MANVSEESWREWVGFFLLMALEKHPERLSAVGIENAKKFKEELILQHEDAVEDKRRYG